MTEPTLPTSAERAAAPMLPDPVEKERLRTASSGGDYRDQLGSRRWDAAPLGNPEVEKTDPRIAVVAVLLLAGLTLLILVAGYATGFWELPAGSAASGAVAALELLA